MIKTLLTAVGEALRGKPLRMRSSRWDTVRDEYLKRHPKCAACGTNEKLQVHHRKPFHLYPDLELDAGNLLTLCESKNKCHLKIGHLGNWKKWNPQVVRDAINALRSQKQ